MKEDPKYENCAESRFRALIRGKLPKSVEAEFEHLQPPEEYAESARTIFNILLAARRSLTLSELSYAFEFATNDIGSMEEDVEALEDDKFERTLITYCGSLLSISVVNKRRSQSDPRAEGMQQKYVGFFHQEARKFLIKSANSLSSGVKFKHAFEPVEWEATMRRCCISYLTYYGSRDMESDLLVQHNFQGIVDWVQGYINAHPFMDYAAVYCIYHLPFDTDDSHLRTLTTLQIATICDVSSTVFRTWFLCLWRIWSPGMPMIEFFRQYIGGWIIDHLHPDASLCEEFSIDDPITDPNEKWWFWRAVTGTEALKLLMEKCHPSYDESPAKKFEDQIQQTSEKATLNVHTTPSPVLSAATTSSSIQLFPDDCTTLILPVPARLLSAPTVTTGTLSARTGPPEMLEDRPKLPITIDEDGSESVWGEHVRGEQFI